MKRDTKVDLIFSVVLFFAIFGVALMMALCSVVLNNRLIADNILWYEMLILPLIVYAILVVHVAVSGRFSVLLLALEILFLFAAAVFGQAFLRPQDTLGTIMTNGMCITMLEFPTMAISVLIEAFGVFVMSRIRKRSITT
jgi:hypothetical protein